MCLSEGFPIKKIIPVKLGQRSYKIEYVESLEGIRDKVSPIKGKEFALIDSRLDAFHGKKLRKVFTNFEFLIVPSGERSKSFSVLEKIANTLVKKGATRHSRLYAIGGGVVGDLTGFLSGVFMRGIPFIQIPTTLLAMVDSSVGGKTAVNIATGKNLVGIFHQPQAVFIFPQFLETLPLRELLCGLSESLKTALIADKKLVSYLENFSYTQKERNLEFFTYLSAKCVEIKAAIVSKDEKEENIRAYLNFGHTLAHAIETKLEYKKLLHGEAVSIGQRFAALLSRRLGYLSNTDEIRIENLLAKYHLPRRLKNAFPKGIDPKTLVSLMRADKKNVQADIRFVLLQKLGKASLPQKVEEQELLASLKEFQTLAP
ncbi:MAG: 3-dehydroquinate synthase [Turneriella sp.]|nr:3-dehydroquinate synthase [Turneriella sp.]